MNQLSKITADSIRTTIRYNKENGVFVWAVQVGKKIKPGRQITGNDNGNGYLSCKVFGRRYYLHRLAWLYVYGYWPKEIDHINGNKSDNRICNLRECTHSENAQNLPARNRFVGTQLEKRTGRWVARIRISNRMTHLGTFDSQELASAAYLAAKKNFHTMQPIPRFVA